MTQERAVLAGGCFWGMQDLIRRLDGVISTRVGYTGGDVPNATYRKRRLSQPGFPRWIGVRPASCTNVGCQTKSLRGIRWPNPDGRDG